MWSCHDGIDADEKVFHIEYVASFIVYLSASEKNRSMEPIRLVTCSILRIRLAITYGSILIVQLALRDGGHICWVCLVKSRKR